MEADFCTTRYKQNTEEEEEKKDPLGEEMNDEDKLVVSRLTSLEDIVEMLGSCGRWNLCLFVLCASSSLLSALTSMSYQFLGATPDHWCRVEFLKEANWTDQQILDLAIPLNDKTGQYERCHMYDYNYTKAAQLGYDVALMHRDDLTDGDIAQVVSCRNRDFNLTQYESTIVTEWDLVCERRVIYATTQAVNQLGFLFAGILSPFFTDKFGRRPVALCVTTLALLQGLASCFSSSSDVFIALRCGLSAAGMAHYITCFLIVMELSTLSARSFFGCVFDMAWSVGCMIVPGIAYLVRPWRYLQAAIILPYVISLLTCRMLPESPRWLLLEGRYEDVEDILADIAATNRRKLPSSNVLRAALTRISRQMRAEREQCAQDEPKRKGVQNIIRVVSAAARHELSTYRTGKLVRRMSLLLVLWFSVAFAYYGLALNATNISADPYLYIFLGGVCEVPVFFMLWLLVARAGRRPSLSGLYFLCALCIALNSSLMYAFADVPVAVKITLSLLGKMAIAAAFSLLYLFTAELFTTNQRSLAVGHCCFFGRIGSIVSPYVNDILGDTAVWAPSAVFSVMAFLSSFLSLLLPETRDHYLPEHDRHSKNNIKPTIM